MQFLELSVRGIRVIGHTLRLHIRSSHRRVGRLTASHTGVSIRPLSHVGGISFDFLTFILSNIMEGVGMSLAITSREGGALVLDDFLKYIVQNSFRIIGIINL